MNVLPWSPEGSLDRNAFDVADLSPSTCPVNGHVDRGIGINRRIHIT